MNKDIVLTNEFLSYFRKTFGRDYKEYAALDKMILEAFYAGYQSNTHESSHMV